MSDDESPAPRTEKFTLRQLMIAAAALAVLGFFLLFEPFSGNDSESTAEPTASQSGDESEATPGHTHNSPSPTGGDDSGTSTPDDEPPELPPGMERDGPTQAPDPDAIDDRSATDVALAAVTAVYSLDTATDDEPEDGMLRVEPWLQQPYDDEEYDLRSFANMIDDDWDAWVEHDGYASINTIQDVVSNDARSPEDRGDTATEAMRKIAVSFTPLGRDGWNGALSEHTWYVHVGRSSQSDPWQITEMRRPYVDPTNQPMPTTTPSPSSSPSPSTSA